MTAPSAMSRARSGPTRKIDPATTIACVDIQRDVDRFVGVAAGHDADRGQRLRDACREISAPSASASLADFGRDKDATPPAPAPRRMPSTSLSCITASDDRQRRDPGVRQIVAQALPRRQDCAPRRAGRCARRPRRSHSRRAGQSTSASAVATSSGVGVRCPRSPQTSSVRAATTRVGQPDARRSAPVARLA